MRMCRFFNILPLVIVLLGDVNKSLSRFVLCFTVPDSKSFNLPFGTILDSIVLGEPSCIMIIDLESNSSSSLADMFFLRYRRSSNIKQLFVLSTNTTKQKDSLSDALFCLHPNKYIFLMDRIDWKLYQELKNIPLNEHSGTVLVVIKTRSDEEDIIEMFKWFSERASQNVFVVDDVLKIGNGCSIIEFYSGSLLYSHLNDDISKDELIEFLKATREQFIRGITFRVVLKSIVPSAYFRNVQEQPLEYNKSVSGVEGILLDTVLRSTGVNPLYLRPPLDTDMGLRLAGGNFTGSLEVVDSGEAFVAGNPRLLTFQWMDLLDFTYPHVRDNYCILVQKAKQVPLYLTLLLPFTSQVWLLIVAAIIVLSAEKQLLERTTSGLADSVFNTFRLFITGTYNQESSKISNRIFLSICLLYNIIVLNSFQGSLYSFLTSPNYLADLHTLNEIIDRVHTVFTYLPYMNMFVSVDTDDEVAIISKRLVPVLKISDMTYACDKVAESPQYGFLLPDVVTHHVRYTYMEDGKFLMHLVEECALAPGFIGYVVKRNWPGLPRLNTLIQRMVEGGFVQKWHDDADFENFATGVYHQPTTIYRPRPMSLEHLQGAFIILVGGLSCSCVIFGTEYTLSIVARRYTKDVIKVK